MAQKLKDILVFSGLGYDETGMNSQIYTFLLIQDFISLKESPGEKQLIHMINVDFIFYKTAKMSSRVDVPFYISTSNIKRSILSIFAHTWYCHDYVNCFNTHVDAILVCFSLMKNIAKYIFMYLFTIYPLWYNVPHVFGLFSFFFFAGGGVSLVHS